MPASCRVSNCNTSVPKELEAERLCIFHFAQSLEDACADIRRESAPGKLSAERRAEIERYISQQGEKLARMATGGLRIPDELKQRLLNTFLTLINLRENLDRAAVPRPVDRKAGS